MDQKLGDEAAAAVIDFSKDRKLYQNNVRHFNKQDERYSQPEAQTGHFSKQTAVASAVEPS